MAYLTSFFILFLDFYLKNLANKGGVPRERDHKVKDGSKSQTHSKSQNQKLPPESDTDVPARESLTFKGLSGPNHIPRKWPYTSHSPTLTSTPCSSVSAMWPRLSLINLIASRMSTAYMGLNKHLLNACMNKWMNLGLCWQSWIW